MDGAGQPNLRVTSASCRALIQAMKTRITTDSLQLSPQMASTSVMSSVRLTTQTTLTLSAHTGTGFPDPFAVATISGEQTRTTSVIKKTLNPYWNESFDMYVLCQHASSVAGPALIYGQAGD